MMSYIYIYTYDLSKFVPSSCHLLPRGAILCALEVQFEQQFMPKSVNAKSAKQGCLRSLMLSSFWIASTTFCNMFLYIYACMDITLSLFLVTSRHLELPNRLNWSSKSIQFKLKYRSWDSQSPSRTQEVVRNPQKRFLLQFLSHIGARFGIDLCQETVFFRVFSAWLFLHALRGFSDWLDKHNMKISHRPKVDLVS